MNRILAAAALSLALSAPAHAQMISGHLSNGTSFHAYVGPQGFGNGFANGLNNALANAPSDGGVAVGSYLPGVITGPDRQLQFEIQVSLHGGGARAFDPTKREHFSGTYAAKGGGFFVVPASVSLIGDRGSRISCEIQIHAGDTPTGNGDCVDRKNSHYQLQF
jgi:hypothetical protein